MHFYRPKYVSDEISFNEGEYYKFICIVKADHGEIVLNCIRFKKIENFNEITQFYQSVMMAHVYRKKMMIEGQN